MSRVSFSRPNSKTAHAVCRRILPQPGGSAARCRWLRCSMPSCWPTQGDGFREGDMPYMQEAWRRGLAAIETESAAPPCGRAFRRPGCRRAGRTARHDAARRADRSGLGRAWRRSTSSKAASCPTSRAVLLPSDGLVRDRVRRPGQPAWLRPDGRSTAATRGRRPRPSPGRRRKPQRENKHVV